MRNPRKISLPFHAKRETLRKDSEHGHTVFLLFLPKVLQFVVGAKADRVHAALHAEI